MTSPPAPFTEALTVRGPVDLRALDPAGTPGFSGTKSEAADLLSEVGQELADLQERLWASRGTGDARRILLVLQGMDTSGKGGVLRHSVGLIDPQGVQIASFQAPTEEERAHDFLWRIRKALPEAGHVGVFDRSHYEDVLIARVRALAPADEIERRYDAINEFEAELAASGTTIIKCLLHISADAQRERLTDRLERPEKHWKYHPSDLDDRALWPEYREAYEIALERTSTPTASWHVIPADKKWYRNLAVAQLLVEALRAMELEWPAATFDVAAELRRLSDEEFVQ